ncbi:MAG: hydroxyacid dehydrogenase, partial [Clostridia bacterium]|nr:hydroxyacid dehydrogenase [Clostridia bacterium]
TKSGFYTEAGAANILRPVYHELYGKTWGVVGYGAIGEKVAEVAKAFGCRVLAFKRTPKEGVECTDIDTLMKESDIITVHLPLSEETRGLIDKKRIDGMKKTAILVNTARGAVCDETALCEAVGKGRIAGIGVDVFSKEPFEKESPYDTVKHLPNVCLTPHMAWGAKESRERCFSEMLKNTEAFLEGKHRNRVD